MCCGLFRRRRGVPQLHGARLGQDDVRSAARDVRCVKLGSSTIFTRAAARDVYVDWAPGLGSSRRSSMRTADSGGAALATGSGRVVPRAGWPKRARAVNYAIEDHWRVVATGAAGRSAAKKARGPSDDLAARHARYDDAHPHEALEIVKLNVDTKGSRPRRIGRSCAHSNLFACVGGLVPAGRAGGASGRRHRHRRCA